MEEKTEEKKETVDITRWNRAQRRRVLNGKLMGRNLPYVKAIHGSIENYNKLRTEEIEKEEAVK